jgi:two-component system, chemotaxis family, response regulator PixG
MDLKQNRERDKKLVYQLALQEKNRFTGKLIVKTTSGLEWSLHFCVGRLVWATGGNHVVRRLYRHLSQSSSQITVKMLALREKQGFKYGWDYQAIDTLVLRKQLTHEQAPKIVTQIIDEVLFDLLQCESRDWLTYAYEPIELQDSEIGFFILLNINPTLKRLLVRWKTWKESIVGNILLQAAPVLHDTQTLKLKIRPPVYQTLIKFINGKRTLREVAALMKKDEIQLVRWLSPLIRTGYVRLCELPDLPRPESEIQPASFLESSPSRNKPIIACVDDSPQVGWQMQQIIEKAGYGFIGLHDSVHALGILIDRKPDLIFLDLMMPIVSGYELCAQIRRVSGLKNVPIAILTGGIVDRLRATIVGASDCLAKPIDERKVLTTIAKYLTKPSTKTQSSSPTKQAEIEANPSSI